VFKKTGKKAITL